MNTRFAQAAGRNTSRLLMQTAAIGIFGIGANESGAACIVESLAIDASARRIGGQCPGMTEEVITANRFASTITSIRAGIGDGLFADMGFSIAFHSESAAKSLAGTTFAQWRTASAYARFKIVGPFGAEELYIAFA